MEDGDYVLPGIKVIEDRLNSTRKFECSTVASRVERRLGQQRIDA